MSLPADFQLGLPFLDDAAVDVGDDSLLIVPDRHGTFVEPGQGARVVPLAAFLDHIRALATIDDEDIIVDDDASLVSAAHVLASESKRSLRLARDLSGLSRMLRHAGVDPGSVAGALGRRRGGREGGLAPLFSRVLEVRERMGHAHLIDSAEALARGVDVVRRGVLPPFLKRFVRIVVRHVVDPTELELEALIEVARAGVPVLFVLPIDPRGRGRTSSTTWIATRIEAAHDVPALELEFEEMRGRGAVSAFVDAWYGSAVQSPVLTADLPVRVEVVADAASEARRIAGVVGHWWRTGGPSPRIAVAFRTLDAHAERVVDAIRDHGLPVVRRDGRALLDLPAGQALSDLFGLARDGMPRERLLSLLSQPIFRRHRPAGEVGRIARTLRRAAARSDVEDSTTPHGGYRHRLTRMRDALDAHDPQNDEIARALAAVDDVSTAIGPLPHRAPVYEFLLSARRMLDEHIDGDEDDASGWAAVDALLTRLMRAHGRIASSSSPDVELSPFTRFLERVLKDERVPQRAPSGSAIEVLPLAALYGRTLDYVVIGDCVHGKLPRAERGDPLLSDSDKALVNQALGARALRLVDEDVFEPAPVSPRIAPELLAFAGAIASASRGLLLTAAARDARGREVAPSDFLEEALIALGAPPDAASAGTPFEEDVHPRMRTVALSRAIVDDRIPDDVDVDADTIARVEHARTMSRERSHFFLRASETSVVDTAAPFAFAVDRERVSRDFGHLLGLTAERPLTPTRLEALAACPYRGFVEHVLRVDTTREAGQDADSRVLGRLAHKALEVFFKERKEQGVPSVRMTRDDELRLDALVDENAAPLREGKETGHLAALDANVRWLKRSLRRTVVFLAQHPPYPGAEPMAFELSIGVRRREGDANADALAAVPITVGDRELYLGGEIDRVDLVRDERGVVTARVVVDYKSSTAAAVEKKLHHKDLFTKHFQIPLYLRLLDHHAKRKGADFAGYLVSLRDGVSSAVIGEEVDLRRRVLDDKNERGLAKGIGRVILPILDGVIAPIENWGCGYCRVARICRHDDVTSESLPGATHEHRDDAFVDDEDAFGGMP